MPAWLRPVLFELLQLVPVFILALPFAIAGTPNLETSGNRFVWTAGLAVLVTIIVRATGAPLNPLLIGVNLWLLLGATAFGLPFPPLADAIGALQGASVFLVMLGVGIVATIWSPHGYLGMAPPNRTEERPLSWIFVALTGLAAVWAWLLRDRLVLGAILPFVILNVGRRVTLARVRRQHPGPA